MEFCEWKNYPKRMFVQLFSIVLRNVIYGHFLIPRRYRCNQHQKAMLFKPNRSATFAAEVVGLPAAEQLTLARELLSRKTTTNLVGPGCRARKEPHRTQVFNIHSTFLFFYLD